MLSFDKFAIDIADAAPTPIPILADEDTSPRLFVLVVLDGVQRLVCHEHGCEIIAEDGGSGSVLLLNTLQHRRLAYSSRTPSGSKLLLVHASHAWFRAVTRPCEGSDPVFRTFLSADRAHLGFPATRYIADLARQIFDPPPDLIGEVRELYRKSRALDILCRACIALREHQEARPRPQLASRRRSEKVRDYVLANLDKSLTIDEIAAAVGSSVSSVQRHFKEHFRMTVFAYIRGERLAKACAALERTGVTIAEAAYAAGYADPANFTVAFKRLYGVSPKHRRR